ncbi:MAG TPA: asparagine synthase (glutamine-hydrolyzing), partial [Vicinamibacteria bacterium]
MCGFVGSLDFGSSEMGEPSRAALQSMTDALSHRGPDGGRVDLSGRVGLGHRRLRIIDLSTRADQPLWNQDRNLAIVFNGEIYNFRELRRGLVESGARFRTWSDTEVVLELYAREGEQAIRRLDGMFALAIWDARKNRLFLARDRSGKKPLYFYEDGRRFLFASEIKAIQRHPAVSREPNFEALPYYLTYGYFPQPLTPFGNVSALAPASWMLVDGSSGERGVHRYWTPPYEVDGIRRMPEAVERLTPLVRDAVRKRLVSDVPLGAFLSGGMDSTVVVGLMSELLSRPVKTFSIGFEGASEYDELAYAEEAARRFDCEHTSFRVHPPGPELLETLVRHHDGPFGDSSAIPTYIVSRLARSEVTVVLNGDGGDELFCGYSRLAAAAACEHIPGPLRRVAALAGRLLPGSGSHRGDFRRVRQFLESSARPFRDRIQAWCSFFGTEELTQLQRRGGASDPAQHFAGVLAELETASPLARLLSLNYRTYLPEDLLVKMDRMTMAHGLEARSPFLDTALTEFAGSLPDSLKLRGFVTKRVLREAYRHLVPPSILGRRKMGFGVPLGHWFRSQMRPLVEDELVSSSSPLFEHLDRGRVLRYVNEHLEGARD